MHNDIDCFRTILTYVRDKREDISRIVLFEWCLFHIGSEWVPKNSSEDVKLGEI